MSGTYFDFSKEKKHSDFSASKSEIYLHCAAAVKVTRHLPRKDTSYSFEGTVAHELARCSQETGVCATKLRVPKYTSEKRVLELITDEMRGHVKDYCDYVANLAKGHTLLIDTKVKLDWIHKDMSGTLDAAVIEEFGDIQVIDFKYGAGVPVDAKDNSQMIFYGLGLAGPPKNWDFGNLYTHIYQPRRNNISKATLSKDRLLAWIKKFETGIAEALKKDAPFTAGEHCRFCEYKPECPAVRGEVEKKAQVDFADPKSLPVKSVALSPKQIASVLDREELIRDWLTAIRARAHAMAEKGELPGYKIVDGRRSREWRNQSQLEKVFAHEDELWSERKFKSPAQIEKLKGKEFVDKRTTYKPGKPSLVKESDIREKLASKAQRDFEV